MDNDDRSIIQIGDYFNITRPTNDSEIWNNQNRFQTCQLVSVDNQGKWQYYEYWYQYPSKKVYPFLSPLTTRNVFSEYALTECIIKKITNPETEGFKHTKTYLEKLLNNI